MPNQIFSKLDQAAAKAMAVQDRIFGFQRDPDVERYEQMNERDFARIAQVYGPEGLTEYVMAMESRRMKGGR